MNDDPLFSDVKIVVSLYEDGFPGILSPDFASKIASEGVDMDKLQILSEPSYENLMKLVINEADGVVLDTENPNAELAEYVKRSGKPALWYQDKSTNDYLDNYQKFYEGLF